MRRWSTNASWLPGTRLRNRGLNALAEQADKSQQQRAKRAAIDAKSRGLTDRQAEREATEQRLKEQYGDNPGAE